MDTGILQNVPWFLLLLAFIGGCWLGLRLGVRFHTVLANLPLIGVGSTVTTNERLDRLEKLLEEKLTTK